MTRKYMPYGPKSLFDKDGKTFIHISGVDCGGGGQPVVLYRVGDWAVVKESGGMNWMDRLTGSAYTPTTYQVVNVETWEQDGNEVEPGRKWKKALDTMKARVDALAAEEAA